jgi:hypothetical protein
MALFEIVLSKPGGAEEVRYTDHRPAIGDTFWIDNRCWEVVDERAANGLHAAARFRCEVAADRRGRTLAARAQNVVLKQRLEAARRRRRRL